ncbi:hypothetical protein V8B55DRAFT_1390952 [Mucor lusitanicus]|uniref:RING-type E3 ubiquitin transferase n=1 Tax=Mucor circinelloides f. lusitanicus TaxID=29924 RepID=A0A8H4F0P3_MUCCL|nr:hypothetical protein FB192DRAFT_1328009 [Mucor lusitanicus]
MQQEHAAINNPLYECNICLDIARCPVLTLCGHLFCWKCLVVWLKTCNLENQNTTCPVCFRVCDQGNDIIPIYGRVEQSEEMDMPKRPRGHRPQAITYTMNAALSGESDASSIEGFRLFNRHIIVNSTSQILPSLAMEGNTILVETGQSGILSRLVLMLVCLYVVALLFRE